MNSISWFLYLADVVEKVGIFFSVLTVLGGIGALFLLIIMAIHNTEHRHRDEKYPWWWFALLILTWFFFASVAVLSPSKDTLYMIAGSEITETVVNTPEAKEILDETRKAILNQIKELQK